MDQDAFYLAADQRPYPKSNVRIVEDRPKSGANQKLLALIGACLVATTMAFHIFQIHKPFEVVLWGITAYCLLNYIRDLVQDEIRRCLGKTES